MFIRGTNRPSADMWTPAGQEVRAGVLGTFAESPPRCNEMPSDLPGQPTQKSPLPISPFAPQIPNRRRRRRLRRQRLRRRRRWYASAGRHGDASREGCAEGICFCSVARWRRQKKTETAAAGAATLPEDAVLEILARVADAAALFRCTVASKRWQSLVSDPPSSAAAGRTRPLSSASSLGSGATEHEHGSSSPSHIRPPEPAPQLCDGNLMLQNKINENEHVIGRLKEDRKVMAIKHKEDLKARNNRDIALVRVVGCIAILYAALSLIIRGFV